MTLAQALLFAVIIFFSILCSLQDIRYMEVSKSSLWCACGSALLIHLILNFKTCWIYILSGLAAGLLYFLVRKISKNKLGLADVVFGVFQGLCLPFYFIPLCILIEVILSLFVFAIKRNFSKFPFIPFMASGLIFAAILKNVLFI